VDTNSSSVYANINNYGLEEIPIGFDVAITWNNCTEDGGQMFDFTGATIHWDLKDLTDADVINKSSLYTSSPDLLVFNLTNAETSALEPGRYKALLWYEKNGIKTKIGCCMYVATQC
jgi:hypothetical protein